MSEDQPWKTVYYKTQGGLAPVKEFIGGETSSVRNGVFRAFERLRELNIRLGKPHAEKVKGREFWELKIRVGKETYRVFYFAAPGRRFVLLHAIHKKKMKVSKDDLDLVQRRMQDYQIRNATVKGGYRTATSRR